jgi:putative hydrolase of the HAD superfamily
MALTILDLGGVLFNIDFQRTRQAMMSLEGYNGRVVMFGVEDQDPIFVAYDRGDISTVEFRARLRELYGFTCTDVLIDRAWCAILDDGLFPHADAAVAHIRRTRIRNSDDRLVIFSNISELHYLDARDRCAPVFDAVDHVYLSYVERVRKPDPAAFLHICAAEGVHPTDTLLIDDSRANCASASALGMKTIHVVNPLLLTTI